MSPAFDIIRAYPQFHNTVAVLWIKRQALFISGKLWLGHFMSAVEDETSHSLLLQQVCNPSARRLSTELSLMSSSQKGQKHQELALPFVFSAVKTQRMLGVFGALACIHTNAGAISLPTLNDNSQSSFVPLISVYVCLGSSGLSEKCVLSFGMFLCMVAQFPLSTSLLVFLHSLLHIILGGFIPY